MSDSNTEDSSLNIEIENYEILQEENIYETNLNFKVIVIGEAGVGKSSLSKRAIKNIFEDTYNATIGFDFFSFFLKINDKIIQLQIWDTCGQEIYRSLITQYYKNASLAIIVYSINNRNSFDNIDFWLKEIRKYSNPDVKVFVIGNKIDLENERKIDKEEAELYCKKNKIYLFFESSAKISINTQEIFIEASKILYKDYLKYQNYKTKKQNEVVTFPSKNDDMSQFSHNPHQHNSCC